MIADTYDPTTTIAAQQAVRENSMISEDAYYKSAGKIDRPLPDHWPWPVVAETFKTDDAADKALEGRVTAAETDIDTNAEAIATNKNNITTNTNNISAHGTRLTAAEGKITTAEGKITTLEGKVTTAEGEIDTLQSGQASLEDRVEALETPAAG